MAPKSRTHQAKNVENSNQGSSEATDKAIEDMAVMQLNMEEMMQKQLERQAKLYENMMSKMQSQWQQPQYEQQKQFEQQQFEEEENRDENEEEELMLPQFDRDPDNHNLHKRYREYNTITFKGGPDPKVAEDWIIYIDRIFWVMRCSKAKKVLLGTFSLTEEV